MTAVPELDYHALCIDTNIFRETGYAFDKGLPAQLAQFADSPVQVVISEIVLPNFVLLLLVDVHYRKSAQLPDRRG